MSGNRKDRRGLRDPEEYQLFLEDPRGIAKALLDENERETREGQNIVMDLERLGYRVRLERY